MKRARTTAVMATNSALLPPALRTACPRSLMMQQMAVASLSGSELVLTLQAQGGAGSGSGGVCVWWFCRPRCPNDVEFYYDGT